jgi:hypothetical protein
MTHSTHSKDQLDRGVSLLPGEERRRSQRVIIMVPVTLELAKEGKVVKVAAHTVAVNIHGAMVVCQRTLDPDAKVEIVNERTRERAIARVTRAPRHSAEGFLIPLEFLKPFPIFWQITFPPSNWKPTDL